ncbi:MAG: twin-arginine translocase subunit TatC [Leptospiraceae bacterium]|nr:twin-arginine translocase subunit TatC [Leptospiraceae bacterium]
MVSKKKTATKKKKAVVQKSIPEVTSQPPEEETEEFNPREKYMTLGEHLEELRMVIIKSLVLLFLIMIVSLWYGADIHKVFVRPYKNLLGENATFFQIKLMAPIVIYLKTSFVISVLVGLPFLFFFLWSFVAPALDVKTERYGRLVLAFSTILFWSGVLVCWFTVFENMLEIFLVIFRPPDVDMKLPIDEYYDIFFNIHLVFGLSFQLPIILILLGKVGILPARFLASKWREATIIISIFSAVMSPGPEVFSMLMLFIPLMILFGISLFIMILSEKKEVET